MVWVRAKVGRFRGELGELGVVELDPVSGGEAPIELVFGPPRIAEIDVDERGRGDLVLKYPQRVPAFVATERQGAVIEKTRGLLGRSGEGRAGLDEVPRLAWGDFEAVLAIDHGGGHAPGGMRRVGLHALGHQIPARHPLEHLAALGVVADRAQDEGIRAEAAEMPSHVEGRPPEHAASVREVVKQHLAENDRSVVRTVHGLSADGFLGAGGLGPS
jgi:hypothetical protein